MHTGETMGEGMTRDDKFQFFRWLADKGVTTMTEVTYEEVTAKGLTLRTKEGKRQIL